MKYSLYIYTYNFWFFFKKKRGDLHVAMSFSVMGNNARRNLCRLRRSYQENRKINYILLDGVQKYLQLFELVSRRNKENIICDVLLLEFAFNSHLILEGKLGKSMGLDHYHAIPKLFEY